jgi:hypothetical protein
MPSTTSTYMKTLEKLCLQWWWVFLCLIILFMLNERSAKSRQEEFTRLREQLNLLNTTKYEALAIKKDLELQINSQSDPEWVELVLRKGLGLVPEGQTKVFFDNGT